MRGVHGGGAGELGVEGALPPKCKRTGVGQGYTAESGNEQSVQDKPRMGGDHRAPFIGKGEEDV